MLATGVVIVGALAGALLYRYAEMVQNTPSGAQTISFAIDNGGKHFLGIAGGALGIMGGILVWAYQTGNKRLGVVDLFACEIDTLCRVVTVMNLAARLTDAKQGAAVASHFNSDENYFPILEADSGELQNLSAIVVADIAAFYTYMKTVRDSFRQATAAKETNSPTAIHSLVYMLYLALESGRLATKGLVQFEPTRTERIMVVLLSELAAYQFLRVYYDTQVQKNAPPATTQEELELQESNALFSDRLTLRGPAYTAEIEKINTRLKQDPGAVENDEAALALRRARTGVINSDIYAENQWAKALQTLAALNKRFEELAAVVDLSRRFRGISDPAVDS